MKLKCCVDFFLDPWLKTLVLNDMELMRIMTNGF